MLKKIDYPSLSKKSRVEPTHRPEPSEIAALKKHLSAHQLSQQGCRVINPDAEAFVGGFTVDTLDEAYKNGNVTPGQRRELLSQLRRVQKDLDRKAKRR